MSTLIISQTIFYIVSSIAIIVVAVLLAIVIYYLICILRNTRNISDDITHTYHKTKKNIKKIINSFNSKK
ncbi:MAG: hypothetical protein UR62_C0012G0017 [Candidatus Nomurabacteria bacterium GW2011_GWF2_35_12]|uniref:Uncharacterized protein n=2 Tax=Candidatus Nomuraibacteriota TaxID=1752729 RepID=A0A0G0DWN5_9BACT|nr:MAG: hypothetical protein UR62_C0012G0017 [Candidatus Nomurabacteria bacterium GW2011_GWF2_35_12]KKP73025.1 MAG: hypothetical protein UR70_C0001G0013 [Candidatus Nomurabacteria bacterium GW2011_GWB1_35_20]KKP76383.1 MAG: hypothetical protein UR72_C0002G0029 [Parcubacteria group bacterium GW2011_GWC1_35_21]KKP85497.1 MAG: hypothetical protein UR86_C0001G0007 [Parcubacteria group bacterium GW2011_GWD2_35_7]KKP97598.1 MAG: hypothetical protein US05_C0014G0013 [Candidatus Nomurabacteria bacteriu